MAVSRNSSRSGARSRPGGEDRRAAVESTSCAFLGGVEDRGAVLVEPRLLLQPRQRLLEGLQVGEDQLGVDRLDVVRGVDPAVDVHDVGVGEHPDHLADRVGSRGCWRGTCCRGPAPSLAPLTMPAMSTNDTVAGRIALGAEDLGEHREPRVGHADDADVRLDRGERVVRREHVVLGQGVEQRGLADVGQADDADGEATGGESRWRGHGARSRAGAAAPPGFCRPAVHTGQHGLTSLLLLIRRAARRPGVGTPPAARALPLRRARASAPTWPGDGRARAARSEAERLLARRLAGRLAGRAGAGRA